MPSQPRPDSRYTYADYLQWDNNERWELINGIPSANPMPSLAHRIVIGELFLQIGNFLRDKPYRVFVAPFHVRLLLSVGQDDGIIDVVQPDISVIFDENKLDKRGCRGAPNWIIEVLSPVTALVRQLTRQNYSKSISY